MKQPLALKSFRLKNFKAIRDSGEVRFTPLTVFIGNNGSGKSSLIEGLQTYQEIVLYHLDTAMNRWRGFEYITNPPIDFLDSAAESRQKINPIEFTLRGQTTASSFRTAMKINMSASGDEVFIEKESLSIRNRRIMERNRDGQRYSPTLKDTLLRHDILPVMSILSPYSPAFPISDPPLDSLRDANYDTDPYDLGPILSQIIEWQFVTLNPFVMGEPKPQHRGRGGMTIPRSGIALESDGSNIAEYLLEIRKRDQDAFEGIIDTLQQVLPYVRDLQPTLTSELERAVFLQMTEENFKIPGWLLSTGTLRILALLALFRHPSPPSLIVIEEIENGLDPNTIHMLIDEISHVIKSGRSQVILTTHSPYLLDYLSIDQICLVDRSQKHPTFYRPADEVELEGWKDHFRVGQLYTSGKLRRK
jgi:predicted ATPase